jgi:hypothetical protein
MAATASLKARRIAAASPCASADFIDQLLAHTPSYSVKYIADSIAMDVRQFQAFLALPDPEPILANWTPVDNGAYPYAGPFQGLSPIAFGGLQGGFTYGAPVYIDQ